MYADQPHRRVLLPTYPFQRRRFWGPDKPRAFHAEYHTAHPLLGSPVSLAGVETNPVSKVSSNPTVRRGCPITKSWASVVMPGAAYVEMAIAAAGSDQIDGCRL